MINLLKSVSKMEKLEVKEKEFMKQYDLILSVSPYGQIPYVGSRAIDKGLEINKKRAKIWNEIRSCIIGTKTLWQIAIELKMMVEYSGNENILHLTGKDIQQIINMEIK